MEEGQRCCDPVLLNMNPATATSSTVDRVVLAGVLRFHVACTPPVPTRKARLDRGTLGGEGGAAPPAYRLTPAGRKVLAKQRQS
jgi:hypothetical protein